MIRKMSGLKFLRTFFPEVCVDCVFVDQGESVPIHVLNAHDRQMFRVRSGRSHGSELNLPQRTCYSSLDVLKFITDTRKWDSSLEFVIHRVDQAYFDALFVGTIALFMDGDPRMVIDFQPIPDEFAKDFNADTRPRDWKVAATFTYPFLERVPKVEISDALFNVNEISHSLHRLWSVGRDIATYSCCSETVSRFNIYSGGDVLLDDHRSVGSFVESVR